MDLTEYEKCIYGNAIDDIEMRLSPYDIRIETLRGSSRKKWIVRIRRCLSIYLREVHWLSNNDIGIILNRDASTISDYFKRPLNSHEIRIMEWIFNLYKTPL